MNKQSQPIATSDGLHVFGIVQFFQSTQEFSLITNKLESKFLMSGSSLKSILEKLGLKIFNTSENNSQGLGSQNLLYIAAELLLLKKTGYAGLNLYLSVKYNIP